METDAAGADMASRTEEDHDVMSLDKGTPPILARSCEGKLEVLKGAPPPEPAGVLDVRRPTGKLDLRQMPPLERLFWKDTNSEQLSQQIQDRYADGRIRSVTQSELLVMALNEIATHYQEGFFLHLPHREIRREDRDQRICPVSRATPPPMYVSQSVPFAFQS